MFKRNKNCKKNTNFQGAQETEIAKAEVKALEEKIRMKVSKNIKKAVQALQMLLKQRGGSDGR